MTSPSSVPWLRPLVLAIVASAVGIALPLAACSSDDSSAAAIPLEDASQTPIPKIEAGSACATNNDCQQGLVCLYPATACNAFRVCTSPLPDPCDNPQAACSCLGEPIIVCDGYAADPVDPTAACDGGVLPDDGGLDSAASGTPDSGPDSGSLLDASDASG
jgi:hypothetical protein